MISRRLPTSNTRRWLALPVIVGWLFASAGAALAAGPPFPQPVPGVVVYDEAGIFSEVTEGEAARIIEAIEARTGAEIVVYTQVKPGASDEQASSDAQALGTAWGVGRAGFDDGLVILFDMEVDSPHGAVRLEPGSGFKAAYLSADESQAIFDEVMLPALLEGNLDRALLAGLAAVDGQVTNEETWKLEAARITNAVLGLVVAPVVLVGLVGFLVWRWYRYGRDPVYTDDPSVLMPAPPQGLSPAGATLIMAGRSTARQLTSAMVDLAARGEIAFRPEPGILTTKVAIIDGEGETSTDALVALARRRALEPPEADLLVAIQGEISDGDGAIEPDGMVALHGPKTKFDSALERHVTSRGWFREAPSSAVNRWRAAGIVELLAAVAAFWIGMAVPLSGATLVALALGAAGIVTLVVAGAMPARTMAGARLYAWLSAYRRTLKRTLEMARSLDDVVASRAVPWLETPDRALVWGVALGLHDEIEQVLARTATAAATAQAVSGPGFWMPGWYGGQSAGGDGGAGGLVPGLFSTSAVPDFEGMFSALSSVGSAASTSRSSGSGFGGGGGFSGGGGGGRF